jgi:hypothetical protein
MKQNLTLKFSAGPLECLDHEVTKAREEHEARRSRSTELAQKMRSATNPFVFFVLRVFRPLRDFVVQTPLPYSKLRRPPISSPLAQFSATFLLPYVPRSAITRFASLKPILA